MASYLYEQLLGNLLYLIFLKFCQCFSISYIEVGVHLVLIQISFHYTKACGGKGKYLPNICWKLPYLFLKQLLLAYSQNYDKFL